MKTIAELRDSSYHEELGQKLFAAYLAQQQGISMNAALKQVTGPMADAWLFVAECARQAHNACVEKFLPQTGPTQRPN